MDENDLAAWAQGGEEGRHERAEALAKRFHEAYESLAPLFGYRTREASAKPWADVPEQNRALMICVCDRLLREGIA